MFTHLLNAHSVAISPSKGIKSFLLGQVVKYIPGKIWPYILHASLLPQHVNIKHIAIANIDLVLFSVWRNFILGIYLLLVVFNKYLESLVILVIGIIISAPLTSRRQWNLIINMGFKSFVAEHSENNQKLVCLLLWITGALGVLGQFILLHMALRLPSHLTFSIIGLNMLSWVISAILLVFPAGIGIREYSFIQTSNLINISAAISAPISILMRAWWMCIDILSGFLALFIKNEK